MSSWEEVPPEAGADGSGPLEPFGPVVGIASVEPGAGVAAAWGDAVGGFWSQPTRLIASSSAAANSRASRARHGDSVILPKTCAM